MPLFPLCLPTVITLCQLASIVTALLESFSQRLPVVSWFQNEIAVFKNVISFSPWLSSNFWFFCTSTCNSATCLVSYKALIILQPLQQFHCICFGVIWLTHLSLPNIRSWSSILILHCLPKLKQTNNNNENL